MRSAKRVILMQYSSFLIHNFSFLIQNFSVLIHNSSFLIQISSCLLTKLVYQHRPFTVSVERFERLI